MKNNRDERFIFCTPFLSEIDRIRRACGMHVFKEPEVRSGNATKLDSFNELLREKQSIAVTHSTFINATAETKELIAEGEYHLILDECVEAVQIFEDPIIKLDGTVLKLDQRDVNTLIAAGHIQCREDGLVVWEGENGAGDQYDTFWQLVKKERIYCEDNTFLVTVFPADIFRQFQNVDILTYMFGGTSMSAYLDAFDIPYQLASVQKKDGEFFVSDYDPQIDLTFRQSLCGMIHLCEKDSLNAIGTDNYSLSKSWFVNHKEKHRDVKNALSNFFCRTVQNKKAKDIMWTSYQSVENALKGKGYTKTTARKCPESASERERKEFEQRAKCFVPCNSRATNLFGDRSALAYAANIYAPPQLIKFYAHRDAKLDQNRFALGMLIQWLMRSSLRNGQPVELFLPSRRMRGLLNEYLKAS